MSGPKCGRILPSARDQLWYQCVASKNWLAATPEMASIAEIERELALARKEVQTLRATFGSGGAPPESAAILEAADRHREDLTLLLQNQRPAWTRAEAARARLKSELASREAQARRTGGVVEMAELVRGRNSMMQAQAEAEASFRGLRSVLQRVDRHRREIRTWNDRLETTTRMQPLTGGETKKRKSDSTQPDPDRMQKEIEAQAALEQARARLAVLQGALESDEKVVHGWLKDSSKWEDYCARVSALAAGLDAKRVKDAEASFESAEQILAAMREEAEKNKASVERNERIAAALMQALCDKHYNTPKFGELQAGDPLSGVQIRADVPNVDGRGNLRVDIHFDGRTVFEVENVPEGEEAVCREVIDQLGKALATEGLELKMTDWGRATKVAGFVDAPPLPKKVIEPEREQEEASKKKGNRK